MIETWRAIPNFPLHEASSLGRIRSNKTGRIYKTNRRVNNSGYESIKIDGQTRGVHVFVGMAFYGLPINEKNHINHKNGNKRDNRPENIEWVSRSENMKHAFRIKLLAPYDRRAKKIQMPNYLILTRALSLNGMPLVILLKKKLQFSLTSANAVFMMSLRSPDND